ncbi:hypothetical protein JCM5350_001398 [Sporobolomyces pararoseus]
MRAFSSSISIGAALLASTAFAQEVSQTPSESPSATVTPAATSMSSMASSEMSSMSTTMPSSSMSAGNSSSMASSTQTSSSAIPTNSNGPMAGGGYGAFNVTPEIEVNTTTPYNYSEPYRNQFHYSAPFNWLNDPNGLLYENGTYHLFYQYNPTTNGTVASFQSWGHAISEDLVKWETLPVAIVATQNELIFSGSAVMDYNNTSGFGNDSTPAMVAIYATAHIEDNNLGRQAISIAYSLDQGRNFTKFNEGAPVIDLNVSDLRDPNVKWDAKAEHWRLTAVLAESYEVIFFSSPDLKNWTELSRFGPGPATRGGVWECPDLFELEDPTNPGQNVSVLIVSVNPGGIAGGSGTWYLIGDYNNGTFTPNDRSQAEIAGVENWLDYGADNYAGLTFTDAPSPVFIGWMSNWWYGQDVPTSPWRSADTVPRSLSLREVANGKLQLHQEPFYALGQLYSPALNSTFGQNSSSTSTNTTLDGVSGETLHIDAVISVGDASAVGFNVRVGGEQYTSIGFNASSSEIFIDRTYSGNSSFNSTKFPVYHGGPITLEGGVVKFEILVDVASVEVFAESGNQTVLTDIIFPDASSTGVQFFATNGTAELVSFTASNVQSIWNGSNSTMNGTDSSMGGSNSTSSSAMASATQTGGPVSTGMPSSTDSGVAPTSSMESSAMASSAVGSASAVFSSATEGLLPPTQSVAQRYARAILRGDY